MWRRCRRGCVSLQWVVGRLSADKSMSHSLCLVRPNTPEADHSLPAYKLKQIASSMLYYLLCCWVLFQTSHWEVVLTSQRLMTGSSTSFACFKLRMSNDHRHEFIGSAANEWSVIHCHSVFAMLLLQFQSNTFVYNQHTRHCTCVCAPFWKDWTKCDSHQFVDLTKGSVFPPGYFFCVCVFSTQGMITGLVIL